MANLLTFDTLQYVKKLREVGVSEKVAEVQAEALKELLENNLATKQDISDLKRDIATLKLDMEILRVDLKRDIDSNKKDLTIRMGSMFAISVSVLSVLLTLINKLH